MVVTDFAQGIFTTVTFLALSLYLVGPVFEWTDATVSPTRPEAIRAIVVASSPYLPHGLCPPPEWSHRLP